MRKLSNYDFVMTSVDLNFIVVSDVPENMQLQTLQAAIMLLPDENRETLSTLLYFLADVASNFDENQMNASNLATCFAPSLFYQQIGNIRLVSSSASPK